MLKDADFLAALEACTIAPADFNHAAHIRAGYLYLQRHEFIDALGAMRRAIKAFAAAIGQDQLYHETITIAFMTLINERIKRAGSDGDWTAFARENPDLFTGNPLGNLYSRDRLASAIARQTFLLPDRGVESNAA